MNAEIIEKIKKKNGRPGREIKIPSDQFDNENVTIKIGTADDKNNPKTVFIAISFWVDIKDRQNENEDKYDKKISREYSKQLSNIYKQDLRELLLDNNHFPF